MSSFGFEACCIGRLSLWSSCVVPGLFRPPLIAAERAALAGSVPGEVLRLVVKSSSHTVPGDTDGEGRGLHTGCRSVSREPGAGRKPRPSVVHAGSRHGRADAGDRAAAPAWSRVRQVPESGAPGRAVTHRRRWCASVPASGSVPALLGAAVVPVPLRRMTRRGLPAPGFGTGGPGGRAKREVGLRSERCGVGTRRIRGRRRRHRAGARGVGRAVVVGAVVCARLLGRGTDRERCGEDDQGHDQAPDTDRCHAKSVGPAGSRRTEDPHGRPFSHHCGRTTARQGGRCPGGGQEMRSCEGRRSQGARLPSRPAGCRSGPRRPRWSGRPPAPSRCASRAHPGRGVDRASGATPDRAPGQWTHEGHGRLGSPTRAGTGPVRHRAKALRLPQDPGHEGAGRRSLTKSGRIFEPTRAHGKGRQWHTLLHLVRWVRIEGTGSPAPAPSHVPAVAHRLRRAGWPVLRGRPRRARGSPSAPPSRADAPPRSVNGRGEPVR